MKTQVCISKPSSLTMYLDNYKYLTQNHPILGKGTFGQLSCFGPERCYVMNRQLSELENDGWKGNPAFKPFIDSLAGIDSGDDGIPYIKKSIKVFFERYKFVFDKHMVTKWRSSSTLHYMFGGDSHHSQALAAWLVNEKNYSGIGEESGTSSEYQFPDRQVTLGEHH